MQKYFEKIIERLEKKMNHSFNQRYKAFAESIEIVNQVAEECKDRIFINGQCCWQSCACTEKCQECNRYTLSDADIDWYESIEDWDDEFGKDTNVSSKDGLNTCKWIPCSVRLPEEHTEVLGYGQEGYTYIVELYDSKIYGKVWQQWNGGDMRLSWIIAWQPLPNPFKPKGEEQ